MYNKPEVGLRFCVLYLCYTNNEALSVIDTSCHDDGTVYFIIAITFKHFYILFTMVLSVHSIKKIFSLIASTTHNVELYVVL